MSLLALPVDVQVAICIHLDVEDVLALQQTCRVLHEIGRMDYVWHHLKLDLPLNLPPNKEIESLRNDILQPLVIKALRLQRNWSGNTGKPRKIRRIGYGGIIEKIQVLGDHWMVVISRKPQSHHLLVCSLRTNKFYEISEASGGMSFAAYLHEAGSRATVAKLSSPGKPDEVLEIYSLTFFSEEPAEVKWNHTFTVRRPHPRLIIRTIQVHNEFVMASAVETTSWKNVFFALNTRTSVQRWLYPDIPEHVDLPRFKLFQSGFVIYSRTHRSDLLARWYDLPVDILSPTIGSYSATSDFPAEVNILGKTEPTLLPSEGENFEYYLPEQSTSNDHTPVLFLPSDWSNRPYIHVSYLELLGEGPQGWTNHSDAITTKTMYLPTGLMSDVSVGETGRYAVWVRRHEDDSGDIEVMRGTFSRTTGKTKVAPLVPPPIPLPFEPKTATCLSLDEATGRVCVGLFTGDIWILEF